MCPIHFLWKSIDFLITELDVANLCLQQFADRLNLVHVFSREFRFLHMLCWVNTVRILLGIYAACVSPCTDVASWRTNFVRFGRTEIPHPPLFGCGVVCDKFSLTLGNLVALVYKPKWIWQLAIGAHVWPQEIEQLCLLRPHFTRERALVWWSTISFDVCPHLIWIPKYKFIR